MATDIIIANPPWYYRENGIYRFGIRSGSRWPFTVPQEKDYLNRYRPFPFWLAYAQSLLTTSNINSVFIDSITRGDTISQFYDEVVKLKPKFLFFEPSTPSINYDLDIIQNLHNLGIGILVGGPHATVFANELIKENSIYAVFCGEYEFSLLDFFTNGEKRGIYKTNQYNIDDLPEPHRDKNILWMYRERTHGYTPFQISIITSRGCPYKCIFCQWPKVMYDNKIKFRSILSIENEIKNLIREYGNDIFIYCDDETFNLNEERSIKISEVFAKYNLKWSAMCRIDTISDNGWRILYKNGLTHINFGIESASNRVLETINKKIDIERAEDTIVMLKSIGFNIHLTFTFGAPGETEEDVQITKAFYDRVRVNSKQQSLCTPLPGSLWWESLKDKNVEYDGYKTLEHKL